MSKRDPVMRELEITYDTNLLDNKPETEQVKYINSSIMNRNNGKGNKVIKELTYNHYTKYKPIVDFIGGPKTLSIHWHPQYKKIIYIFGEKHANTMDCEEFKTTTGIRYPITVPIEDYLYDLMKSTDVFLDIYFEFSFPSPHSKSFPEYPSSNQRLHKLLNKFKKCLVYDSRHEKSCRLARSHYFDIRQDSSNPRDLEERKIDIVWVRRILDTAYGFKTLEGRIWQLKKILGGKSYVSDILRKLTDTNDVNIYEFMFKQLKENRYIKKELGKIVENRENLISAFDSFFYAKLRKTMMFYDNKFVLNIDKIRRSVNTLLNYKTTSDDELNDNLGDFLKAMLLLISCFADAYLLARVFKNFNMSEMEEKAYKGATHQPNRAHNIIIYAGDAHADNYREFLSYIGFTEIDSLGIDLEKPNPYVHIPNMPRNCLDMRNIKQPFFSYNRFDKSSFDAIKQSIGRLPATIQYD
jgi:hypothetical protein